ncbi:TetR/AcrR family transcriptional regulator [Acuticoccus sediminis]|uniref:TetR/AcrR family transcriptional regulator n=1 Tax=Acuticoccus sediminis TaxID=2184697 RepID=A0A8B2NM95_9HYPH|nr:TetR/AcrR family transcriptional regulator [Acuticoccus sediminis]RAH99750.1 TetR/AcrR family transcriptional regulator [Acuticoccus sediminis]
MLDKSQGTREVIRQAAERLFARKSYGAVSMRDIAGAVGIRQSAIYNHFPSKQAILADLMVTHMESLLDAWEEARLEDAPPTERLANFARFHIAHHFDQATAVFIAYMELRSLEEDNFAAVNAMRRRYELAVRQILADGVEAGVFQVPDVNVGARALIAMLTGVTTWYREGGRLSRETIAEIYVEMTLRSVGLETGAGRSLCSTRP